MVRSLNRSAVARLLLLSMSPWILGGCTAWQPSDRDISDILDDGKPVRVRVVDPGVLRTELTVTHVVGDELHGTNIVRKPLDDAISPSLRTIERLDRGSVRISPEDKLYVRGTSTGQTVLLATGVVLIGGLVVVAVGASRTTNF